MQEVPDRQQEFVRLLGVDEFSRRYNVLLHATEFAARRGFPEFLDELSRLLHELFDFNFLNYALRDECKEVMRVYMLDEGAHRYASAIELSVAESPAGWVWSRQSPLVLSDLKLEQRFGEALD